MNKKVFIKYQNLYTPEEFLDALSEINRELTKEIELIKTKISEVHKLVYNWEPGSSLKLSSVTMEDRDIQKIVNFSINIDQRNTIKKEIQKLRKDIREVWDYKEAEDKIRVNSIVFSSDLNDRACLSGEWDFGVWRENFSQNNSQNSIQGSVQNSIQNSMQNGVNKNIFNDFGRNDFGRYTFWFDECGIYVSMYRTML